MVTRGRSQPDPQACPVCDRDDPALVSWDSEAPGVWRFTCSNVADHHPHSWLSTGSEAGAAGAAVQVAPDDGGLYDDLVAVFAPGDAYLEYGIVEYRYAVLHPEAYRTLVDRYSHTVHGPVPYTASSFLGTALAQLARDGRLASTACRATGYWSYCGDVRAYCLPPGPADGRVRSWGQYAGVSGFSPLEWPPLDHDGGDYYRPLHPMVRQDVVGMGKPTEWAADPQTDPETGERNRIVTGGWRRPTSPRRRI